MPKDSPEFIESVKNSVIPEKVKSHNSEDKGFGVILGILV
jgi:hypothetical protein